jgi:hypothetical protein
LHSIFSIQNIKNQRISTQNDKIKTSRKAQKS